MRERVGLARSRPCNDEKRAGNVGAGCDDTVLHSAPLLWIESCEVGRAGHCKPASWIGRGQPDHDSFATATGCASASAPPSATRSTALPSSPTLPRLREKT